MVLVAPESEVKVSQLLKLMLQESIATVITLASNANLFPLSCLMRFRQLIALCSGLPQMKQPSYFFFCLPPRYSSPRCPHFPHLKHSSLNFERCFSHLDFEEAGWGL